MTIQEKFDRLELEMQIATIREWIKSLRDDINDLTGDELLETRGELASMLEYERQFKSELDNFLYWDDAIHVIRRLLLSFALKETERSFEGHDDQTAKCSYWKLIQNSRRSNF